MLHPCEDYYKGVIHVPHDYSLGHMVLECPGKWEEGGTAALAVDDLAPLDSGSGGIALEVELESLLDRELVTA